MNQIGQPLFVNQIESPFGLVAPGHLGVTKFEPIMHPIIGTLYCCDLINPQLVNSLGFFLTRQIDEGFVALLYSSPPPFIEFELIGAISNQKPSEIIPTFFGLNPHVNTQQLIKLAVSVLRIDANVKSQVDGIPENQGKYIMKIGYDMEKFLANYPRKETVIINGQEQLAVRTKAADEWLQRFKQKHNIDPNFLYK
ncbi:hypothetical protein pb186bvf_006368 [Paramecium bursaria]